MPWDTSPERRKRDQQVYGSAEYRTNRKRALARAAGRCELCGSARRVQVDHIYPVSQGGGHQLANLQVLCLSCHQAKTAAQPDGGGYRNQAARSSSDPPAQPRTQW